ncbi:MAG: hypothetical protein CL663_08130 [Bacteroidetes bacterium]|nr:hypothetical protein [Bacteroidota bacterium]|tara:strand:- start:404 stop:997 length:594 start_codon:yes stop_codon:yes gene_type:complete
MNKRFQLLTISLLLFNILFSFLSTYAQDNEIRFNNNEYQNLVIQSTSTSYKQVIHKYASIRLWTKDNNYKAELIGVKVDSVYLKQNGETIAINIADVTKIKNLMKMRSDVASFPFKGIGIGAMALGGFAAGFALATDGSREAEYVGNDDSNAGVAIFGVLLAGAGYGLYKLGEGMEGGPKVIRINENRFIVQGTPKE